MPSRTGLPTDRRLIAANGRVAASELRGAVEAERYSDGIWRACIAPVAALRDAPEGEIQCQLVHGDRFRVLDIEAGWAFGQSGRDGYVGHVLASELGEAPSPTHRIAVLASHVLAAPDPKAASLRELPYGARIAVEGERGRFFALPGDGFVPAMHVRPLSEHATDHVAEAERFLGVPYLWGGNGPAGIDCSGLVQMALIACGRDCPRDSDQQCELIGRSAAGGAGSARHGDLAFWEGHVGLVADDGMLVHATAHAMSVAREPFREVLERIARSGEGKFLGIRRP